MTRSGRLVVLALALALGLVLRAHVFGVGGEAEAPIHPQSAAVEGIDSSGSPAAQDQMMQTTKALESRSAEQQPEQRRIRGDHAPDAQVDTQHQAQYKSESQATEADASGAVDVSVVGHPFPVSQSILARCESTRPSYRPASCEPDKKLLAEMLGEPREEPWATKAEGLIHGLVENVEKKESGNFTIRALECRTSICFLEVASIFGPFTTTLYEFERDSGLRAEYPVDTVETDENGAKAHVMLWPFTRR